jgi:hypothetical protein
MELVALGLVNVTADWGEESYASACNCMSNLQFTF